MIKYDGEKHSLMIQGSQAEIYSDIIALSWRTFYQISGHDKQNTKNAIKLLARMLTASADHDKLLELLEDEADHAVTVDLSHIMRGGKQ